MYRNFRAFIRAISISRAGRMGVILSNTAFFTMLALELLRLTGILTNAYLGLVTYMALPLLFTAGLLLIPFAWWRRKKQSGLSTAELLAGRFGDSETAGGMLGSQLIQRVAILTLINILFLGTVTARMLHFMEEPVFCGTACHVMEPEWSTYQGSPHANVKCVSCHVGEGAEALIDSKINGLYQVLSVSLDLYERPIPTPVHQLRPARETCEKCHWPDKFYGSRMKTISHFEKDSANSRSFTTLNMKVGRADGKTGSGIHWHTAEAVDIRYSSLDEGREMIVRVLADYPDGSRRIFERRQDNSTNSDQGEQSAEKGMIAEEGAAVDRLMDCVDCHNRATHRYEDPEKALDLRLASGDISSALPWIKKAALSALNISFHDRKSDAGKAASYLREWYRRDHPDLSISHAEDIEEAASAVYSIVDRNIHPAMQVGWNPYPDHLGHRGSDGCFRCHRPDMQDSEGRSISQDCTLCHDILAWNSPQPFHFLQHADSSASEYPMMNYLKEEFTRSYTE